VNLAGIRQTACSAIGIAAGVALFSFIGELCGSPKVSVRPQKCG
jgi:hypothetical protein